MSTRLRCFVTVLAIFLAVGMVVPSSYAQNRAFQVFSSVNPGGAFLGIRMTDVTEDNLSEYHLDSVQGVIVQSVEEGSPAESADLKEKDVLLEFAGTKVWSTMQFSRLVQETPPGRKVEILFSRAGKRLNVTVQLADRNEKQADGGMILRTPFGELGGRDFYNEIPDLPERNSVAPGQQKPRLGLTLQPLTEQLATHMGVPGKKGALVSSVMDGSPSYGKLKAGDVIISAGGKEVETPEDLTGLVRRETGDDLTFKVIRDKKEITVTITLPTDSGKGFKL
jgi:serine protease Do